MVAVSKYKGTRFVGFVFLASIYVLFSSTSTIRNVADLPHATITNETKISPTNYTSSFLFSKDDADFKPTTRLSEQKCESYAGQPLKKVASFELYDHLRNLTELTTVRGEVETPLAICRFNEHQQEVNHFPHVMQHLYMCYSFWQDNPSKVPVLYVTSFNGKDKMFRIFRKTPFLNGFVELLTSQLKVQIFTDGEIINWLKTNTTIFDDLDTSEVTIARHAFSDASLSSQLEEENIDIGEDDETEFVSDENEVIDFAFLQMEERVGADIENENVDISDDNKTKGVNFTYHEMEKPIGYVLSHVDQLNRMVEKTFDFSERKRKSTPFFQDGTYCPAPKIGILNRKFSSGRSITNAESLVQKITSELFGETGAETPTSPPVLLTHFEGKTFQEQVQFFRDVDLLISPHGAQLIGIPFMANKGCTKMIELFPDNYLVPDYFGTLAVDSGVEYSYIYVSKLTPEMLHSETGRIAPETSRTRGAVRKQNMCVAPAVAMQALRDAVKDWCKCMVS